MSRSRIRQDLATDAEQTLGEMHCRRKERLNGRPSSSLTNQDLAREVRDQKDWRFLFGALTVRAGAILGELAVLATLTRLVPPHSFGTIALHVTIMRLATIPFSTGMPILAARLLSPSTNDTPINNSPTVRALQTASKTLSTAIAFTTLALGNLFFNAETASTWSLGLLGASIIFVSWSATSCAIARNLGRPLASQIPDYVIRPFAFAAVATALIPAHKEDQALLAAMLALSLSTLLSAVASTALLRSVSPVGSAHGQGDRPKHAKKTLLVGLIFHSTNGGMQLAFAHSGVLLLASFGTATAAGEYRAILQIAVLPCIAVVSQSLSLLPEITRLHTTQQRAQLKLLFSKSTKQATLVYLITALPICLFPSTILRITYGEDYSDASSDLVALTCAQIMVVAAGLRLALLRTSNRSWQFGTAFFLATIGSGLFAGLMQHPTTTSDMVEIQIVTTFLVHSAVIALTRPLLRDHSKTPSNSIKHIQ